MARNKNKHLQIEGLIMSKKVADVIVQTLQAAGVKHCYGIVGDTLNRSLMP